ncbi:MAG: ABC transporter ATP-binding protein [Methanobacterium sp.]|jgi:methyl coenzyme M reductase system subunit A2
MIEIKNLSKTFQIDSGEKIEALNNVNLQVKDGEILGIIGISGSGKSTLLRIIRGVEPFDEGHIILDSIEVKPDSTPHCFSKLKKETAIHLQRSFGLWGETSLQNVIRKLSGVKYGDESLQDFEDARAEFEEQALEILKVVCLDHKADHYAPVLSGGEKQRLIMARQLAKQPKVLLLDEPATMSCPKTKQEILDAIKNIKRELGVTVVLVSHLPEVHEYLADRVVLMKNGRIIDEGPPEKIISKFREEMEPAEDLTGLENIGDSIIKVEDLSKRFFLLKGGNTLQIKDINLDIKKGEIVSLIGPSGAGKTVLLRMIAGLDFPDSGNVCFKLNDKWVNMQNPGLERMEIRRKMGFMHQEFSLTHHATVKDQIASRLGVKNENVLSKTRKKAEELGVSDKILDILYQLTDLPENEAKIQLEKIGLSSGILETLFPKFPDKEVKKYAEPVFKALDLPIEILDRKSYELSGGQKVRATLALVLTSNPEVLILDEPFGDLDPITLRIVSNSLKRINKEFNTTILMVSHHMDFVREVANRVLMMDDGKLVEDGDPQKVSAIFLEEYKAEYLIQNN